MITKITKKQQKYFDNLIQKYIDDITDFPPLDKDKSIEAVEGMYKNMGFQKPIVIFGKNPYETALMAWILQIKTSPLKHELNSQLNSQLYSQLRSQLYSQLNSQLDSQLYSQLDSQLRSQSRSQLNSINNNWYQSLWWRFWDCYYQFGLKIGVNFDLDKLTLFNMFLTHVYFCIPYDGICFVSEPPIKTYWNDKKQLHKEGAPSVEFKSSIKEATFGVWSLNGVRVPQYLAETPTSKLDIEFFKNEKNADVKAEFIRKFGIERMVSLGELIDTWQNHTSTINFEWYKKSEYKLIDMASIFTTYNYMPYLYMKNQTVPGIYHLECCYNPKSKKQPKTILEALKVRLNGINPESVEITAIA